MSTRQDEEVIGWIERMRADVAAGPEAHRPGAYWDELITLNAEMIRRDGIRNLKRTVSNNYFNWAVVGVRDPQMVRAMERWARHPRLATLRARMEDPPERVAAGNEGVFEPVGKAALVYRFFVSSLWDLAIREDVLGLTSRLAEPEVGNPVRVRRGGRLISQDLANSIIESSYVRRAGVARGPGAVVGELGAGYGRLAHVYAETGAAYCIFDIPPALAVSQWYLREVLGPDRIVPYRADASLEELVDALRPGRVAFLTPAQLELFPDGFFDLTQTISTLAEMPREQSAHFLELLPRKSSDGFFLKQWQSWRNEADDTTSVEADYVIPEGWGLAARREDPVQPAFFDQLWRRRS